MHAWTAPAVDDGNPIPNFRNSWLVDVETGSSASIAGEIPARALAADNATGRLFAATSTNVRTYVVDAAGALTQVGSSLVFRNAAGIAATTGSSTESMGFANGTLYASATLKFGTVTEQGLFAINPTTGVATLVRSFPDFPMLPGMDFNADDGFMYGVFGSVPQSLIRFDLSKFTRTTIATLPMSAYNGVTGVAFTGLAAGAGKLFLSHGLNSAYGSVKIAVYDLASQSFVDGLPTQARTAENRLYSSGATYFTGFDAACLPDVNDDTVVDGIDLAQVLSAWGACPGCAADINGDGTVGGADLAAVLSAWGSCDE